MSVKKINEIVDDVRSSSKQIIRNFDAANNLNVELNEKLMNYLFDKDIINAFKFMCNVSNMQNISSSKKIPGLSANIDTELETMKKFNKTYAKSEHDFFAATFNMVQKLSTALRKNDQAQEGLPLTNIEGLLEVLKDFNATISPEGFRKAQQNIGRASDKRTWAQKYINGLETIKAGLKETQVQSGKPTIKFIKETYAPYLEQAKIIHEMLKSVDKKIRNQQSQNNLYKKPEISKTDFEPNHRRKHLF